MARLRDDELQCHWTCRPYLLGRLVFSGVMLGVSVVLTMGLLSRFRLLKLADGWKKLPPIGEESGLEWWHDFTLRPGLVIRHAGDYNGGCEYRVGRRLLVIVAAFGDMASHLRRGARLELRVPWRSVPRPSVLYTFRYSF